ncbi:hypothetical protein AN958_07051 [Leucoagaricus sp. SymC.cos]|nr:hypothetical protein AN958_07051 [Leucoagaricus sp. SymC.cos]
MAISNSGLDIDLTAKPHIAHNSAASDTATIWFNVWDSQTGALTKKLQKQYLTIGNAQCVIWLAKAQPGTPQCQHYWKWGHPTTACHMPAIKYPRCSGPHSEQHHRDYAGCCKGNAKATPPIPPTAAGIPCPHVPTCSNCGAKHTANDHRCKFWCHHFDADWFKQRLHG